MTSSQRVWLGIGVLFVAALALRIYDLDGPTITHPEAYAPGIDFPDFARHPVERHTLTDIVRGTLTTDNHPPGYYFLMLPWAKLFGASLFSLRLPAALIGALTAPLLFFAMRKVEGTKVAALAATWLAFHGFHVLWSGTARMWVPCAALVVSMVWAAEELRTRYTLGWAAIYLASVVAGLWVEYNFWPIFVAHVLWQLALKWETRAPTPLFALACLGLALCSPVLIFLVTRSHASEYLRSPLWVHIEYTAAFGHWFRAETLNGLGAPGYALHAALALSGVALMTLGIRGGPERKSPPAPPDDTVPRYLEWALWLSVLAAAAFVLAWHDLLKARRLPAMALGFPLLIAAGYSLLSRQWHLVQRPLRWLLESRPGLQRVVSDASVMHSLVPFGLLTVVSLKLPCLVARGLLTLTPFLLILASRGLFQLLKRPVLQSAAFATVALLGLLSSRIYDGVPPARDFKGLAAAIDGARKPGDVLLIEDDWYAQGLHYYLRPDMMKSRNYAELATPGGQTRFESEVERTWLVGFGPEPRARVSELAQKLSGYQELKFVDALEGGAALFERKR